MMLQDDIAQSTHAGERLRTIVLLWPRGNYFVGYLFVFAIAAFLRILLSLVNREGNDNHYEVVKLILEGRSRLTMADCHECFHPKLYYYVCAAVVRALALTDESSRIVAGQLLNSIAGLITLGLVFFSLNASRFHAKWRFWTFALIALNPRFIAINGQFSNDSFAILLATAAIFLTLRLLQAPSLWLCVGTQLMLTCALMTKGTTWVVAIAMLMIFLVRASLDESKQHSRWFAGLYILTVLNGFASIQLAGYDFEHYDVYANMGRGQPLHVWEKTSVGRPGVQSIVDGYLTFRIMDLVRDPQITNGKAIEQQHRTSVWTQLYARANFAQFEQHPKSWLTNDPNVLLIAKCSLVLGLLPLVFLLVGLARGSLRSTRQLWLWVGLKKIEPEALADNGSRASETRSVGSASASGSSKSDFSSGQSSGVPQQSNFASLFSLLVCLGYIAFIIKFTADYRDFAAMKLIYMLPGVLPLALSLLEGMQTVTERLSHVKFVDRMVHCLLLCLVILHVAGIVALVKQLAEQ